MKEIELLLVSLDVDVDVDVKVERVGSVVRVRENDDLRAWLTAKRAEVRSVAEVVVWRRMLDCACVRSEDFCVVRRRERARPSGTTTVFIFLESRRRKRKDKHLACISISNTP